MKVGAYDLPPLWQLGYALDQRGTGVTSIMLHESTSRGLFLSRTSLIVTGAGLAGLSTMSGCSSGGRSGSALVPRATGTIPAGFTRRTTYAVKRLAGAANRGSASAQRGAAFEQVCTSDDCGGGGVVYGDPSGTQFLAQSSDGSVTATGVFTQGTGQNQVQISAQQNGTTITQTVTQPVNFPAIGETQTSTYSNGASLQRTATDGDNAYGVYTDAQGNTYTVSCYCDDSSMTFTYTGPSSGSFTVSLGQDMWVASTTRSTMSTRSPSKRCSAATKDGMARVATAFDVAGIFLACIGIVPIGFIVGVIGAAIGVYGTFC